MHGSTSEIEVEVFRRYLRRPTRRRLARVVRALHGHVWNVAIRVAGNHADAADICQDVFLSLLLDPPPADRVRSPKGYLAFRVLTFAERMGRSAERRRKREIEAARRLATDDGNLDTDTELIRQAISGLPERVRATVELRYLAELGQREVAAALEVSERTVSAELQRGRELLRDRLGKRIFAGSVCFPRGGTARSEEPPPELLERLLRIGERGGALRAMGEPALAAPVTKKLAAGFVLALGLLAAVSTALLERDGRVVEGVRVAQQDDAITWTSSAVRAQPPRGATSVARPPGAPAISETPPTPPPDASRREQTAGAAPSLVVRGYVVDERDRRVPGAWVGLFEPEGAFADASYSFVGLEPVARELRLSTVREGSATFEQSTGGEAVRHEGLERRLDEISAPGTLIDEVHTDERGTFEFSIDSREAALHLECFGPDDASYAAAGPLFTGDGDIALRLRPRAGLHGEVVDAQSREALSGARVLLEGEDHRIRTRTDLLGRFGFDSLPVGGYDLRVVHADYNVPHRSRVEVTASPATLEIEMADSAAGTLLSGRITDAATGMPVGGAEVSTVERYRAISNEDGLFELLLADGDEKHRMPFEARAPGYGVARTLVGEGPGPFEWNVALERASSLVLRVVGSDGEPAADAGVVLDLGGNTLRRYGRTGADGTCVFEDLPRDLALEAFAFHSTLGRGRWSQKRLADVEGHVPVLQLEKGPVTIEARVQRPDGSPVAGARVILRDRLPDDDGAVRKAVRELKRMRLEEAARFTLGEVRSARSDLHGRAVVPDTFAGYCLVQAVSDDSSRSEIIALRASDQQEPLTCELVLARPLALGGSVMASDGRFVHGARVTLLTWSDAGEWEMNRHTFTNERGDYRFGDLDPGRTYAVGIEASDASRWNLVSERPSRDAADEEFGALIDRRDLRVDPADFAAFVEVPEHPESATSTVDLLVEGK